MKTGPFAVTARRENIAKRRYISEVGAVSSGGCGRTDRDFAVSSGPNEQQTFSAWNSLRG